jgi:hypothetical protein
MMCSTHPPFSLSKNSRLRIPSSAPPPAPLTDSSPRLSATCRRLFWPFPRSHLAPIWLGHTRAPAHPRTRAYRNASRHSDYSLARKSLKIQHFVAKSKIQNFNYEALTFFLFFLYRFTFKYLFA